MSAQYDQYCLPILLLLENERLFWALQTYQGLDTEPYVSNAECHST